MSTSYNPPDLGRLQRYALIVGVIALVLFLAGLIGDHAAFHQAYIFAFTFWLGISVGSLALLMLQHLTSGGWGFVIRRVLEAATRVLPLMAILFLPIVLGAGYVYPWTHHEEALKLGDKTKYLNLTFFTIRAIIYLGSWLALMFFLNRWSLAQDRTADPYYTKRMRMLSGPGMVLLIFTVTFASVDWYMSIEPEWFSTIYGFIYVAAWAVSALAFVIATMAVLSKREPLNHIVAPLHFHDHGKLLLALVMLWAYFAFSQFLIIWSGNLPEEIGWYTKRMHGVWGALIIGVVILHFALPFLLLLSRSLKRDPRKLVIVAAMILVMRVIDLLWMLRPGFSGGHSEGAAPNVLLVIALHVVGFVAIGGLWLGLFARELGKRSLIPINDPQYESVLEQAHAGH
ncbi:MAG TPA: hypothetical protein VF251_05400 [Pyrinomonadaceae bacterium]